MPLLSSSCSQLRGSDSRCRYISYYHVISHKAFCFAYSLLHVLSFVHVGEGSQMQTMNYNIFCEFFIVYLCPEISILHTYRHISSIRCSSTISHCITHHFPPRISPVPYLCLLLCRTLSLLRTLRLLLLLTSSRSSLPPLLPARIAAGTSHLYGGNRIGDFL